MKQYNSYREQYLAEISPNAMPLYCLMGDETLYGEFNGDTEAVYKYCIDNKKTWEDVLNFKFDPNSLY